jgi:hypothetical protein
MVLIPKKPAEPQPAPDSPAVYCDIEVWVRSKSGLRVRSRGRIFLNQFLALSMLDRGEAVSTLIFGSARKVAEACEKADREWEERRREEPL